MGKKILEGITMRKIFLTAAVSFGTATLENNSAVEELVIKY